MHIKKYRIRENRACGDPHIGQLHLAKVARCRGLQNENCQGSKNAAVLHSLLFKTTNFGTLNKLCFGGRDSRLLLGVTSLGGGYRLPEKKPPCDISQQLPGPLLRLMAPARVTGASWTGIKLGGSRIDDAGAAIAMQQSGSGLRACSRRYVIERSSWPGTAALLARAAA